MRSERVGRDEILRVLADRLATEWGHPHYPWSVLSADGKARLVRIADALLDGPLAVLPADACDDLDARSSDTQVGVQPVSQDDSETRAEADCAHPGWVHIGMGRYCAKCGRERADTVPPPDAPTKTGSDLEVAADVPTPTESDDLRTRIEALHKGTHQCVGGVWWTDDPDYHGNLANRGLCPTRTALSDTEGTR